MIDSYLEDVRYVIHYYNKKITLSNRYGNKGARFGNGSALIIYGKVLFYEADPAEFYQAHKSIEFYEYYLDSL